MICYKCSATPVCPGCPCNQAGCGYSSLKQSEIRKPNATIFDVKFEFPEVEWGESSLKSKV